MEILKYIFYLGVIFTGFDLLWWAFRRLLGVLNQGQQVTGPIRKWALNPLGLYLVVSLSVLETTRRINMETEQFGFWLFAGIGAFTLLFYRLSKLKQHANIRMSLNGQQREAPEINLPYEWSLNGLALVGFALGITMPELAANRFTNWLHLTVQNLYEIPILGWGIAILSFLFLLRLLFQGIQTVGSFLGMQTKSSGRPTANTGKSADYDSFEVVEEEDESSDPPHQLGA